MEKAQIEEHTQKFSVRLFNSTMADSLKLSSVWKDRKT